MRAVVAAPPGSEQGESDIAGDALGRFLAGLNGRSCVLPRQRVRELTGVDLPETATSASWWKDAEGWPASPVAAACRLAGWRLDSVTESARAVRFVRIDRDAGTSRKKERRRPSAAGIRSAG